MAIASPKPVSPLSTNSASAASTFKNAERHQESFSAQIERRALAWLAARVPSWMHSDHLTMLGFTAMALAGASYAFSRSNRAGLLLATVFLALNWLGDSLDGTLARFRGKQRPRYGFYVDHVTDTIGGCLLMSGLAISGLMDWRIALGTFIAFLMLSIESYLAAYTLGVFRLSFAKLGPTEIRILLGVGNLALCINPAVHVLGSGFRLFDVGGIIAIAGMAAMLVVSATRHTIRLYREETLP
jgi:archaetidylinositol phosphate synthase